MQFRGLGSFLDASGEPFPGISRLYFLSLQYASRFVRLFTPTRRAKIDCVMCEDRFCDSQQSEEVLKRCVRRATCTLDWRGRPTAGSGRRDSSRSQAEPAAEEKPAPFLEQAGEPSIYERAFVQVLPCFPDAYRAVVKYMRQLVGLSPTGIWERGGGGSDKEPVPV